ncbi:OLC1v1034655C1 [Oldenlandia corymbosa var. corymbosa]|uniref:OLC1v1034655C1 n=1 Tax=Oldenlandia corymbosa var. corymbosa TaxID=529605 RepID=A0AAV1CRR3_OLDCO|nr:OLC1v1034655C1 [Oldenlandia corymbosa var. corymbosa]
MEEERDNGGMDLQLRRLSLIDFSSENDALVHNSISSPLTSSSPAGLAHGQPTENQMQPEVFESLVGSLSSGKDPILTPSSDQDDQFPDLKESVEPDCFRRKAKCNLRKSLAWDSAFFTSAGVLDPEELSCMIKGAEKSEKKMLPGIEEDFRRSNDSISTLESDHMVMENLEAELFGDIRASIQKSSKAFTAATETSKKKMNISSQNQKQQSTSKKPISVSKPQIKQTLRTNGTARAVNLDAVRSQAVQSVARPGNSNPAVHKPPRVTSNAKPTPTVTSKGASLSATETNKIGTTKTTVGAVPGRVPQASKANVSGGAHRLLPKSASSSKGPSLDSSISAKSTKSSPTGSSGRVSTEKVPKSLLAPVQRKAAVKTVNPPSAGSSLTTPSKTVPRNKKTSGNSAVSAYLMSSKISSSVSPASSISEWSSASSSSSCTVNFRSKSRTSIETSSCRSSVNDITSDFGDPYDCQMLESDDSNSITVPEGSARKSLTQTSTLSHSKSARPSGLRLPSPKIGFFDGVKSIRTPNGSQPSHASLTTSTVGAAVPSPRSASMKPKIGKLSHPRGGSALSKTKPQGVMSCTPSSERSQPLVNDFSGLSDVGVEAVMDGESFLKTQEGGGEVVDQANRTESTGIGVLKDRNDPAFAMKTERNTGVDGVVNSKDTKVDTIGDFCEPDIGKGFLKPSVIVDKDGEGNLATSVLGVDEKENAAFREHVDSILGQ